MFAKGGLLYESPPPLDLPDPLYQGQSCSLDNFPYEPLNKEKGLNNWFRSNMGKLALGATVASVAVTVATNPLSNVSEELVEKLPLIGGTLLIGEAMWIGGAAMMLAAVGEKVRNPITMKSRIPQIAEKANKSRLFKSGLWINTIGAVSEFAIAAGAVCTQLPYRSWGLLAYPLADLGITIGVRMAIIKGIKRNTEQ